VTTTARASAWAFAHSPTGVEREAGDLHNRLDEAVAGIADQVVAWRHHIH
jgi:hypothetical protein